MNFDKQIVDFKRFLEPAPESDFNGAYSGITLGTALVALIVSQMCGKSPENYYKNKRGLIIEG